MILKGNQRAGGDDLASHLMNLYDNDAMELAEIRGTVAQDLHGAFAEFEALATGTRCKQPLYSLSINPSQPMSREHYAAAIDRIEAKLGLTNQPRAVVYHIKEGRPHCHVVWSRIDPEKLRAVQLSHDRQKLRSVAQELAQEFGHELPSGLKKERGAARYDLADAALDRVAKSQAELSGLDAEKRRAEITAAYQETSTAQSFIDALWTRGYQLARGDKRGFVVVDRAGNVHSLARQVQGARTKEIAARLAPLTPENLPTVAETRARIRQEIEEDALDANQKPRAKRSADELRSRQAHRRAQLAAERQALELRQREERMQLHIAQKQEAGKPFARAASAVFGLFGKMPVLRSVIAPLAKNPNLNTAERHRLQNEALERRYEREARNLDRRDQALSRTERRELASLTRDQKRVAQFEAKRDERTRQKYREFAENRDEITRRAGQTDSAPDDSRKEAPARDLPEDRPAQRPNRPRGPGYGWER